ncbi:MAG: hypothetical protein M3376_02955 [Actinomycetota bacterium]|nr:hypothetical protein [Actinomycetota bacterium]
MRTPKEASAIVASDVAEHSAKTWYVLVAAPPLRTLANQLRATSPATVFPVEPVSSSGPLSCTTPSRVAPLVSTPPPVTR